MRLPTHLQCLTFGANFTRNVDNVIWPNLQCLRFGGSFRQNLENITWPNLQSLTFDCCETVSNVIFPDTLRSLVFGSAFNLNVENVHWPLGLENLEFLERFAVQDLKLFTGSFPKTLRRLQLAGTLISCR